MRKLILIFLTFLPLLSCSKDEKKISLIEEKSQDLQLIEIYNEAVAELRKGDVIFAAKKFNEAELIFPQSEWAPKASLMAAYAYYSQSYFSKSITELERYLDKYKKDPNRDYAYYLLALCYYDQIVDEKKDLKSIIDSEKYFKILIKDYPNTDFAIDSEFKLQVINEILASKEMYLARYYVDREKWIPANNRFKKIVNEYSQTIFVEEALHRLVEINYRIGLVDESKKYASLLGYNYKSSTWYEESYKIFNKNYVKSSVKNNQKESNKLLKSFKELLK